MIAKPIADKLSLRSEEEALVNTLCIEAVYGMAKGHNPMVIEEGLVSFLSAARREDFSKVKDELIASKKEAA